MTDAIFTGLHDVHLYLRTAQRVLQYSEQRSYRMYFVATAGLDRASWTTKYGLF